MGRKMLLLTALAVCAVPWAANEAHAQLFGAEANNTLMPASGGMAGTSIAEPQDLGSAINGNPATLTQFAGTQFMLGIAWAEPTINVRQTDEISGQVEPFSAKSSGLGLLAGNAGVTQDFSALGLPATFGLGLITTTGGSVDYRQVEESGGVSTSLVIVNVPLAVGVDLTDRLSVGAGASLGIAMFDPPFYGAMSVAYGLRGVAGVDYRWNDCTTVGAYYQTRQEFHFDNAIFLDTGDPDFDGGFDLDMAMPENYGLGIANRSLAGGRLLLAVDLLYKKWDSAALYRGLYDDQWVIQTGAQYSTGCYRWRLGYAWAENPIDQTPDLVLGGFELPGSLPFVRFSQSTAANTSSHRLTGGVGVRDVLPGIDFDFMAGGMFLDHERLGPSTFSSIQSYWLGCGLTWRFGRGACRRLPVPEQW